MSDAPLAAAAASCEECSNGFHLGDALHEEGYQNDYTFQTLHPVSLISNLLRNNCSALTVALNSGISHFDLITKCNVKMYKERSKREIIVCLFVQAWASHLLDRAEERRCREWW